MTTMFKRKDTKGWYWFADGTKVDLDKLTGIKRILEIRKHGEIIVFVPAIEDEE